MDIRVLVFNSGTFNRAELSKMSEQELWQLWEKDEDQAQVQMYYLDEFSCAFNDEEVSDQDWLYFVDADNVHGNEEDKQKVYAVSEHMAQNWGDDTDCILGVYSTREKAEQAATKRFNEFVSNYKESDWEEFMPDCWYASHNNGWSYCHIDISIEETEVQ